MALRPGHHDAAVERAAPAELDAVANPSRGARLADNGEVEAVALCLGPGEQLLGAVDRLRFLVIGDGERDGAGDITHPRQRGDEGGDAGLHVRRAPAVDQPVGRLGRKGRMRPGCRIARRHHIGMAGKQQVLAARAARREQIVDRIAAAVALEAQAHADKAERH
jgi:hypothetical protein